MKYFLVLIFIFTFFTPVAFADLTCEGLNKPEDTKNLIITILEEEIGEATNTSDEQYVMICFRETKLTTTGTGDAAKQSWTSTYVGTCAPDDKTKCQRVQVIVAQSGIDLLMTYLSIIYRWAATVIGMVSVAYLVWGGFSIATSQDDTSKMEKAKEKIMQSIAGLVLLFLSAIILYTINPNFFTL